MRAPHWTSCLLSLLVLACCGVSRSVLADVPAKQSYLFPLEFRQARHRARSLRRSGALSVHGAVREGYFYTRLSIGTPPRKFTVIIDTGSTITYVPCVNCQHCGKHQDAYFDPAMSKTSKQIACGSKDCFCGWPSCLCKQGKCYYERRYAEQSSSEGWLYSDLYNFPDNSSQPMEFSFGCEAAETGQIYLQEADGILGMGNNVNAFHSQLAASGQVDHMFSLCFGFPSGGGMMLGNVPLPDHMKLSYTPLLSDKHLHYFTIEVQGFDVAGQQLAIDPKVFKLGYGSVLDSGTTFTYLPSAAFRVFLAAIEKALVGKPVTRTPPPDPTYNDVCWKDAPRSFEALAGIFPEVKLRLGGGVTLSLAPYRYLFALDAGKYCLGVFDNGDAGALIGGISVRNVLVQYDLQNNRVGFVDADCPAIGVAADANPATAPVIPPPQAPQAAPAARSPAPPQAAPAARSPAPPQAQPSPAAKAADQAAAAAAAAAGQATAGQAAPGPQPASPAASQPPAQPAAAAPAAAGRQQGADTTGKPSESSGASSDSGSRDAPGSSDSSSDSTSTSSSGSSSSSASSPKAAAPTQERISDSPSGSAQGPAAAAAAAASAAEQAGEAAGTRAEGAQPAGELAAGSWLIALCVSAAVALIAGGAISFYRRHAGRSAAGTGKGGGSLGTWVSKALSHSSFQPVPTSDDCEMAEYQSGRQGLHDSQQHKQEPQQLGCHQQERRGSGSNSSRPAPPRVEERQRLRAESAPDSAHSSSGRASSGSRGNNRSPQKGGQQLPTSTSSRS